ncbi:NAD-dependent epimerase/dehydratase family protein [Arthrobacter sp. PAMC25564]|uniref:SDR family oxidoreductase n=1 Tax=Arthrobacter sp. PAMC25564 TaxID=2565366 RepID=UPI0010A2A96F|nr:NAD(P)H-binding protein [Arthrobacter sp. PAMC25564]QCB96800.1 NAD-dependent epimerase/dehydratase family protein [Arthrobacter sp. PAMC25564]
MTRICVAGGTGQVGREVVRRAVAGGHGVAVLSRNPPPGGAAGHHGGAEYFRGDVTTGEGLAAALAGAAVVIDCLEGRSGKARKDFADGGARLLRAAQDAGVTKAVLLSIINCDRSSFGYYRTKAAKEQGYERCGLETIAVRATQFHSLLADIFAAGSRFGIIPVVKGARFQPVSPSDVAAALLETALAAPSGARHRVRTIGGPEIAEMGELALAWKRASGSRGRLVRLPLPGAMGRYLRDGLNLIPEERRGTETFRGWLAKSADSL